MPSTDAYLADIENRNRLRTECGLPMLSVDAELRRLQAARDQAAFERELVEKVATNAARWGDMIRKTISCALAGLLTVVSALAFLSGLLGYWEPSSGVVVLSLIFGFTIVVMWLGSEVSEIFRSGRRRRALLFIRPIINHPAAEKKMPA